MSGLLLCLLLAASLPTTAHLPELFGRDFVLEPPARPDARKKDGESALDLARDIDALENALSQAQAGQGPYSPLLSDHILQLAARYAEAGNTVASLRSYERALHVLRINNGLLHPVQLPLLRRLAKLQAEIGDWRSAQVTWRYAYRIHGLGENDLDAQALRDALSYFAFVREAFIAPTAVPDEQRFMLAVSDNGDLLQRLLETGDTEFAVLEAVALSQLRNYYILLGTDVVGAQGFTAAGSAGGSRMLNLQDLAYGKGLDILDELLRRAGSELPLTRAALHLRRGNWLQWNGKWRRSQSDYAAIFPLLDDSEAALLLRQQLSRPAELPEDLALWESLQGPKIPTRGVLRASYRVSETGNASQIDVQVVGDTPPSRTGVLRRMIADSHFRPALAEGVSVEGRITGRRYRLID